MPFKYIYRRDNFLTFLKKHLGRAEWLWAIYSRTLHKIEPSVICANVTGGEIIILLLILSALPTNVVVFYHHGRERVCSMVKVTLHH